MTQTVRNFSYLIGTTYLTTLNGTVSAESHRDNVISTWGCFGSLFHDSGVESYTLFGSVAQTLVHWGQDGTSQTLTLSKSTGLITVPSSAAQGTYLLCANLTLDITAAFDGILVVRLKRNSTVVASAGVKTALATPLGSFPFSLSMLQDLSSGDTFSVDMIHDVGAVVTFKAGQLLGKRIGDH